MSDIKLVILTILSGIASYLAPISGNVFALLWLFGINFFVGLACGLIVRNERFEWRKAWRCVEEATILFAIVAAIYVIGKLNGNKDGAVQCVSVVVYATSYFYGTRILRNVRDILPSGAARDVVEFLYSVLSMEFAKNIPGMSEYIQTKKEEQENGKSK